MIFVRSPAVGCVSTMPTMFSLRLLSVLVTAQKSPAGNDSSHSSMLWATISAAVSAACLTTSQVEVLRRLAYGRWFVPTAISGVIFRGDSPSPGPWLGKPRPTLGYLLAAYLNHQRRFTLELIPQPISRVRVQNLPRAK